MLKVFSNKHSDKENASNNETALVTQAIYSLLNYLGKTKLEFESDLADKSKSGMSEYEVHLQKLEAQIREHIRVLLVF